MSEHVHTIRGFSGLACTVKGCHQRWTQEEIAALLNAPPAPEPVREATSRECGAPAMRAGINEDETCCNLCEDCIGPWAMAQSRYSEVRIVDISTAKTQAWCEAKKRPVDPTPAPVTEQGEERSPLCRVPGCEKQAGHLGKCDGYQTAMPPAPSPAEPRCSAIDFSAQCELGSGHSGNHAAFERLWANRPADLARAEAIDALNAYWDSVARGCPISWNRVARPIERASRAIRAAKQETER